MENQICQSCGAVKKLIPAGISKRTNRAYKAFYVCEVCPKPEKPQNSPNNANTNDLKEQLNRIERVVNDIEALLTSKEIKTKDLF